MVKRSPTLSILSVIGENVGEYVVVAGYAKRRLGEVPQQQCIPFLLWGGVSASCGALAKALYWVGVGSVFLFSNFGEVFYVQCPCTIV